MTLDLPKIARSVLILASAVVLAGFVALCLYAWHMGFALGSGIVHLFERYPIVEDNPPLEDIAWHRVSWLGNIENRDLAESSGLAASNRVDDVLFSMNDSGNGPDLFAFTTTGKHLAAWTIDMPDPIDWEAMDSFELDGTAYLLVADVGDNFRWRPKVSFTVIEEPTIESDGQRLPIAWSVTFSYPTGYRDCEAVAVDAASETVYLLSKRRYPSELFKVPLRVTGHVTAEKIAEFDDLPRPTAHDMEEDANGGKYRFMPSGMDIAGRKLIVTTYLHAFLYDLDALDTAPLRIPLPSLGQREAIAFARASSSVAFISKERYDSTGIADIFMIELDASAQTQAAARPFEQ